MTNSMSFIRACTFTLIMWLLFSTSLMFANVSFAQTVTPKSTVTLSKNSKNDALKPEPNKENRIQNTLQERNKALVLEAFDTLFNKRDYAGAERYWSPNYI